MIVNHTQSNLRILTRFDAETKLTEINIAPDAEGGLFIASVALDYKEVDQLAKTLDRMTIAYNEAMDAEVVVALNGMGMTPLTSPQDPARRDLVKEAMEAYFGEAPRHYEAGNLACEAYKQLAAMQGPNIVMVSAEEMGKMFDDALKDDDAPAIG